MRTIRTRLGSLALALVLLMSLLPVTALADPAVTENTEQEPGSNWISEADTSWCTGESPYTVDTAQELAGLALLVNQGTESFKGKTVTLGANIDLSGKEWTPIGGTNTGKKFEGTFEGNDQTISNLNIAKGLTNTASNNSVGLFGACTGSAKLQNFTLHNVDVKGSLNVAAVLGGSDGAEASITDVHVTGSIQVYGYWYVGGILGKGYSTVTDCSVEGDRAATSYVSITGGYAGGIVGFMGEGNCKTVGCTVKDLTVSGAYNGIGGINGILHYGNTIENCTAKNVVVWQNTAPEEDGRIYAGAFAGTYLDNGGKNPPTLRGCTFTGEIYSGSNKTDVLEATRYVGSLWYGSQPPSTVSIEDCVIHMPPEAQVGQTKYDTLKQAIEQAESGATVTLLRDVTLAGGYTDHNAGLEIRKSITIDGQNQYTISTGTFLYGIRIYGGKQEENTVSVAFQNVDVVSSVSSGRCIDTRGGDLELVLDHVNMNATGTGNTQVLTVGGNHKEQTAVKIQNQSCIAAADSGYGIITWNPVNMVIDHSTVSGYGALYLKGQSNSAGSAGSQVMVQNGSVISSQGIEGSSNEFGTIVFEDSNIVLSVHNASLFAKTDAEDTNQAILCFGETTGNQVYISGDAACEETGACASFTSGKVQNNAISITGGTFSSDPSAYVASGYQAFESNGKWVVGKAVTNVSLNKDTLDLYVNGEETLTASITPADAYGDVSWSSDHPEIAAVDANGKVTAKAPGQAVITAAVGGKSAACTVTVRYAPVETLTLDRTELTLIQGGETTLIATVTPDNTDPTVTWTTSNEAAATVVDGKVTAVAPGEAVITVKVGEKEAACKVTVIAKDEVIADVAEPDVTVNESIPSEVEDTVRDTAGSVNADVIADAAQDEANSLTDTEQAELKEKAVTEGLVVADGQTINLFTQAYLEVTATAAETGENGVISITLDITPMVQVVASTASTASDVEVGQNAVVVKEAEKLDIASNTQISVQLPDAFAGQLVYVKHQAESGVYYYREMADHTGKLTFTTLHGFSPFTFSMENGAAAEVNGIGYETLEQAIDAVSNNGTVTLTADNDEDIAVSRKITFILDPNGYSFTGSITAGAQYEMTKTEYADGTIKYTFDDASSSGGGSGTTGYIVYVGSVKNGSVKVSPARADKGDTVTITVTPNKGYELDELTVTDKDGDELKLSDKGNGKYTFTMPGSAVTVDAAFQAVKEESPVDAFLDINSGAWYYDAVKYAVENGLMSGTGTYTFQPNTTLSRGMIAQMLYALEGKPSVSATNSFTDVSANDWYAKAASWTQSKGIITGYDDGRFGPNDPLTREQLALILYHYAQIKGYDTSAKADLSKYVDGSSTSAWAQTAMTWAVGEGLLSGRGLNMLYPSGTATRAEVAQIMMNFCENTAK